MCVHGIIIFIFRKACHIQTTIETYNLPPNFTTYAEQPIVKGKPIASPYLSEIISQSKINENKAINIKNIPIVPNVPLSKQLLKKNTNSQTERIIIAGKPASPPKSSQEATYYPQHHYLVQDYHSFPLSAYLSTVLSFFLHKT